MNHYTYLLSSTTQEKYYIGVRSCKCEIVDDQYKGSSKAMTKADRDTCVKTILKTFATRKEALAHEIELHKLYNVKDNPLYWNLANQTDTKFDWTGQKHKKESIQKLYKPVYCLSTNTTYESVKTASVATGIDRATIIKVCKQQGNFTTAGGFYWCYAVDNPTDTYYSNMLNILKTTEKLVKIAQSKSHSGNKNPSAKLSDIYEYSTNKLIATNVQLTVWAKENGVPAAHLSSTITGKRKHSGGYYAIRKEKLI